AGCQSGTVLSPSALASSLPLGLNATQITPYWALVAWRVLPTGRPVAVFHSRTVPSPSPVASSLPLGLNATPNTPPTGPEPVWRVATRRWVAVFYSRSAVSPPPVVGKSVAAGLNATADRPIRGT